MALGDRIKKERELQGISIKKLAFMADISEVYLREIEKNEKSPSFEIVEAIGKSLKRPLDFFSSKGNDYDELIEREYEKILKDIEIDPLQKKELVELKNFRVKEAILSLYERLKGSSYNSFKIIYLKREKEITLAGGAVSETEIELECLENEVKFYPVTGISCFDKRETGYFNLKINMVPIYRENGETELRILRCDKNFYYFHVVFKPSLRWGERVRFKTVISNENSQLMSRDKILELIKADKYIMNEPLERNSVMISYPTDKLIKRLIFPKDYELRQMFFSVSTRGVEQIREKKRLEENNCFSADKDESGKWICALNVDNPVMGMAYYIYWEPPSEKEYKELLRKENLNKNK